MQGGGDAVGMLGVHVVVGGREPHGAAAGQAPLDVGQANDIHPRDKMDVGHRLALAAEKIAYGKSIIYSGPTYEKMTVEGGKIRIAFGNLGGGLKIAAHPSTQPGVPPQPAASELRGFSVAGEDKKFIWAQAKIEGDAVLVWSDAVPNPVAVRYAWGNNPDCNLYNSEGLPASPFRTDGREAKEQVR